MSMILRFSLLLLLWPICFCTSPKKVSSQRKIYYFRFGCCFTGDSVIAMAKEKLIFSGNVMTDDNMGKDVKHIFILEPTVSDIDSVEIVMIQKK